MVTEQEAVPGQDHGPVQMNDVGPYVQMSRRPNPKGLVLVFVPSLVATLRRAEASKGAALTEEEVLRIRDGCNVFGTVPLAALAVERRRGYPDLDPAAPYEGWLRLGDGRG